MGWGERGGARREGWGQRIEDGVGGKGGGAGALSWQVDVEGGVLRQNGLAQGRTRRRQEWGE